MQIKVLHKNIYKLYSYSRTQEILDRYRDLYRKSVDNWGLLKSFGNGDELCQRFSGISRSTYFRRKKILNDLNKGIIPPSKRPKKVNEPRWRESELQHVLRIRRKNPTYGKAKISVILRRDHGLNISESSVGRILKHLMERGLVTKSLSSSRIKRKRCFKGHAKPCIFKDYKKMKLGERVQIDHMTVTKNGISFKHFQGWERQSKFIDAGIYGNAKSSSARKFLSLHRRPSRSYRFKSTEGRSS